MKWSRERLAAAPPSGGLPSITVIIPCYRYGHFLEAAVSSALDQPGVDVRVVIVDDASPDDSAEVAMAIARRDDRVSVIVHEQNRGHIQTYNDGFAAVDTEFVTLVSADDLIAPGALGRATRLMSARPDVGMVYGEPLSFDHGGPLPDPHAGRAVSWTVWSGREWTGWACRRGRCFILSPEVVMRSEAVRQVGPYNPGLPHSGDFEYWLRTAAHWSVARINGPAQAFYRVHSTNMHSTSFGTIDIDIEHRRLAFRTLLDPEIARAYGDGERLYARAERALARECLLLATRELDRGADVALAGRLQALAGDLRADALAERRGRAVDRRRRRAATGVAPSSSQRAVERARVQVDRVRWKLWHWVGVS